MACQISEKRYQKLLRYEQEEKRWNKLMSGARQVKEDKQQEEQDWQEIERQHEEELRSIEAKFEADLLAKDVEASMFLASNRMRMDELLDVESLEYRRGFLDGYDFRQKEIEEIHRIFAVNKLE